MWSEAAEHRENVLRQLAERLIRDPCLPSRCLAEAIWGPGVPAWKAKQAIRRLHAGFVPAGIDREVLAAALKQRCGRRWDRDSALQILRGLAERLGRVPRMCDVRGDGMPSGTTYVYLFGSWNAALQAAGLPVQKNSPVLRWRHPGDPREDAVRALRAATELAGGPPSRQVYNDLRTSLSRSDWPAVGSVHAMFGSWREALEASGLGGGPLVRRTRPEEDVSASAVRALVSRLAARGFAVLRDFEGVPAPLTRRVRAELARCGVPVLQVRRRMAGLLVKVASSGWPEVPGKERGRAYALRLAAGECAQEVARLEGLTRERVRQLAWRYLASAARRLRR